MSGRTEAVVDRLVNGFPSIRPLLEEHLTDNFGEVLPHLFLGDVTRYLTRLADAVNSPGGGVASAELDRMLAALDTEFVNGDEEVRELLVVSFLENLARDRGAAQQLRPLLKPGLGGELRKLESWTKS